MLYFEAKKRMLSQSVKKDFGNENVKNIKMINTHLKAKAGIL